MEVVETPSFKTSKSCDSWESHNTGCFSWISSFWNQWICQHFHVFYISKHTDELLVLLLVEKSTEMRLWKIQIVKYKEVTVPDLADLANFESASLPIPQKIKAVAYQVSTIMKCQWWEVVWASWDPGILQEFLLIPRLWLFGITQVVGGCFTELLQGREGAQCEGLTSKELLGSTSGAWLWVCPEQGMNVTMYLNHRFYEWFPCSVSCMKCESSPHQKMHLFSNKGLDNTPSRNG